MKMPLYQALARTVLARKNCIILNNHEGFTQQTARLHELAKLLPNGSGIDNGTKIDASASRGDRLVFNLDFHHMNDHGVYTVWTKYRIYIIPDLATDFVVRIVGRNINSIKDDLRDVFFHALRQEVEGP